MISFYIIKLLSNFKITNSLIFFYSNNIFCYTFYILYEKTLIYTYFPSKHNALIYDATRTIYYLK